MTTDVSFLAENRLRSLDERLHACYTRCISQAEELLTRFHNNFPEYTDHSLLHSIEVTNLCNYLIFGQIDRMNAGELYTLLMSALLHDVGMGLAEDEVERFREGLAERGALPQGGEEPLADYIRKNHHSLGALFVMDRREEFYIPTPALAEAIAKVGEGHRVTDLEDRSLYPADLKVQTGAEEAVLNLPFLAAVLRLADEMDISASRNLMLQYGGFIPQDDRSVMEFQKHRAIQQTYFADECFVVSATTDDMREYRELLQLCDKVGKTLAYCQRVAQGCTGMPFPVRQVENQVRYSGHNTPLSIETVKEGERLTIYLVGKLDTLTAPVLEQKLLTQLGGAVTALYMDFQGVTYVSSAGLRVILSAKKKMMQLGGSLGLSHVPGNVMEIFRMTGFDSILEFV